MGLFDNIKLAVADLGFNTDHEETEAFYHFVNDGYLLSVYLDYIHDLIANRWNCCSDKYGNVSMTLTFFEFYTTCRGSDFDNDWSRDPHWKCSKSFADYYNDARQLYPALPPLERYDEWNLPRRDVVLVVQRFIMPIIIDDMTEFGISCEEWESRDEYGLKFQWNNQDQDCPFSTWQEKYDDDDDDDGVTTPYIGDNGWLHIPIE